MVTSLGTYYTLTSSLYSVTFLVLGILSTLLLSLYSMIFFSKGTYSILLSPLITYLPVLTVVLTTCGWWATLVVATPYPVPTAPEVTPYPLEYPVV